MAADYGAAQERRELAAAPVVITDALHECVVDTLAGAFRNDPVMSWFLRNDARRDATFRAMINTMVTRYRGSGWAIAAADGSCATLWANPEKRETARLGPLQQLQLFPRLIKMTGLRRLPRILQVMNAVDENHPKEPEHYYLFMIGVNPAHQGQGLGSTILSTALEEVDRAGMPAYLENSNPKNMPLYERHGFKVMKEIKLGRNGPSLWTMWREART